MTNDNPIMTKPGLITDNIYHVDLNQYGMQKVCSAFILKTPKAIVIMDTGTSDDIHALIKFMKKNELPLEDVKYLVPSHYHFDHFGGGWKLWKKIREHNPNVKVLTTDATRKHLQDAKMHLIRAKRTFGGFVGKMEPLPDDAYEIVKPDEPIPVPGLEEYQEFILVSTPGHTQDHVCPTIKEKENTIFVYLAEAAGTLFHSKKIATLPTSMPPDFKFKDYMNSLEKIIKLEPENVGYCHFGVIKGKQNAMHALLENKEFSIYFRNFVKNKFLENGKRTRPVIEEFIKEEINTGKRTDWTNNTIIHQTLVNIIVAVVYGQLVDLGLKAPK
ncbi:MAG: MBL fold metallo-hydrolase [Promethearchaeota archaeon]